jgi:hypothetical protein
MVKRIIFWFYEKYLKELIEYQCEHVFLTLFEKENLKEKPTKRKFKRKTYNN